VLGHPAADGDRGAFRLALLDHGEDALALPLAVLLVRGFFG
jgi:hypothetical protein